MKDEKLALLLLENFNMFDNMIKNIIGSRNKKKHMFTSKQFFTLEQMKKYDKIELKYLSKELYVSTSSLCILLNKMVENGFVFRAEDPRDRRNTLYGLTDLGRETLQKEEELVAESLVKNMGDFDQDFKDELEKGLKVLVKAAEKLC